MRRYFTITSIVVLLALAILALRLAPGGSQAMQTEPLLFWLITAGVLVMLMLAMGLSGDVIANSRPGSAESRYLALSAEAEVVHREDVAAFQAMVENNQRHAAGRMGEVERQFQATADGLAGLEREIGSDITNRLQEIRVQVPESTRDRKPNP
ncbi:MAG: hypothetical protein ABL907_07350 [Hyphomicrobium sp.]